jgi:hypothetical protein
MHFSDVLTERNQTHLGWSNVGSNNRKNCRGDVMAMEEVSRKTRKVWFIKFYIKSKK